MSLPFYRKFGVRQFIRVDGSLVTTVMNKVKSSDIRIVEDDNAAEDFKIIDKVMKAIPESEFKEQFDLAMERIVSNKI